MIKQVKLSDLLGDQLEEEFLNFDLTEIQNVLSQLQSVDAIDLSHAELLQQQSLRGADILSEYLGKMVKTVSYLEAKASSTKNKTSLEYQSTEGKTTMEMRKWAGECSPNVEEIQIKLAKAKGSKTILEKKYDILIKNHHHYKDIAAGLRRAIGGSYGNNDNGGSGNNEKSDGWNS